MPKFTKLDEIEVGLRYVERVRAMQPSQAVIKELDRQDGELRAARRKAIEELDHLRGQSSVTLKSTVSRAPDGVGFQPR